MSTTSPPSRRSTTASRSGLRAAVIVASIGLLGTATTSVAAASYGSTSPAAKPQHQLLGVDAVSADDVWAVGNVCLIGAQCAFRVQERTWVQHFDGHTWMHVPSVTDPGQSEEFESVAEIGAADVWAVGSHVDIGGGSLHALAEHWDGTGWTRTPMRGSTLRDVDGVSSDDVWAVGSTRIHHWNGTSWSPSRYAPPPTGDFAEFDAVTVIAADDVWAVGDYGDSSQSHTLPLTEHWDGTRWSYVPSPPPARDGFLSSVSASGPDDVWAVGSADFNTSPLVEHWDGTSWTRLKTPTQGLNNPEFSGVTVVSPNDVWAVGRTDVGGPVVTLIEHWNGTRWQVVSLAGGKRSEALADVSAVSASDVWAVGTRGPSFHRPLSLVEHYDGSTWAQG